MQHLRKPFAVQNRIFKGAGETHAHLHAHAVRAFGLLFRAFQFIREAFCGAAEFFSGKRAHPHAVDFHTLLLGLIQPILQRGQFFKLALIAFIRGFIRAQQGLLFAQRFREWVPPWCRRARGRAAARGGDCGGRQGACGAAGRVQDALRLLAQFLFTLIERSHFTLQFIKAHPLLSQQAFRRFAGLALRRAHQTRTDGTAAARRNARATLLQLLNTALRRADLQIQLRAPLSRA